MKRWLVAAGLFIVVIIALIAALPLLVSTDIARERIAAVVSDWLGAQVVVAGDPHVSLTSGLSVVLPDVSARDPAQELHAHFESVEAEVKWWPLLSGHIELSRFRLRKPEIVADAGASVFSLVALSHDPSRWPFAANELLIDQGSFTVIYPDGARERVFDIQGSMIWPGATGKASLKAAFTWRDEPMEVRAGLSDTAVLSATGKSTLNLSLTSTPLRIDFEGVLLGPENLQANGTATLTVPNLRRLLTWAGHEPGKGATLGPFSLEGDAKANADGIQLNGATLELDGNVGTGILALSWRKARPSLQGTLDFEKLDLSGYFSEWLRAEGWDAMDSFVMPVSEMAAADIDLQISARQVRIGAARIGRTAASLLIKGGNVALDIGEAVLYGGSIKARLAATVDHGTDDTDTSETVSLVSDVKAANIDLAALPTDEWKVRPVAGIASAKLNVAARGATIADLTSSLAGRLDGAIKGFTLGGFDLANAVTNYAAGTQPEKEGGNPTTQTPEKASNATAPDPSVPDPTAPDLTAGKASGAPSDAALSVGSGRSMFDTVELSATIAQGIATFSKIAAAGDRVSVSAQGRASLVDETIGLSGTASRDGDTPASLPFLVRGPLGAPQFLPDVNRLIDQKNSPVPAAVE